MIIAGGSDNEKKLMEQKNRWELHKNFLQKISNGSYFPIGSCCQPWLIQAFFLLVA